MTTDPRLERYLVSLEKALMPFPVSDRADIITEIKSHVLAAMDRDPETRLDSILGSLGEPETVANRYLLERGMKPAKTSIHPIVKWLVIGSLGAFAMSLIFVGFLFVHFGSLLKVDGKEHVQILGGLIDIDGENNHVSIGDSDGSAFAGTASIEEGDSIALKFNNGKFEFETSDVQKLAWACKGNGAPVQTAPSAAHITTLDLTSIAKIKCKIAVPVGAHLSVHGDNGKIEFSSPKFAIDANLDNGKVDFKAADKERYKFDLSTQNGKVDEFKSSTETDAHTVKIHINNGKISNQD